MTAIDHQDRHLRIIRWWLLVVAALVFLLVVVGGATRLTESGLSIVEWRPVTGSLPPLSEAQWQDEFAKYKSIPQYHLLNYGMSLSDFKTIYWWEWGHRLLGRLVGVAFLLPFLFFLARGWVDRSLRASLWGIFALGALQGGIGWWMVYSGLADRTEVSQYRLATHLIVACLIFLGMIWTAARIAARPPRDHDDIGSNRSNVVNVIDSSHLERDDREKPVSTFSHPALAVPPRLRATAVALVVLVLVQIYLGALVAGLRAGYTYNTWPLMDGYLIPPLRELLADEPVWRNLFENALAVQFNHRMAGYLLWVVAVLHAFDALRTCGRGPAANGALLIAGAMTLQALTGVVTLVYVVPIGWALVHQGLAVLLLAIAARHLERLSPRRAGVPVGAGIAAAARG